MLWQRVVLRRTLIAFLALSLGRVPVPWVHSHAWLDAEQLDRHLAEYHPGECEWDLPCGIHLHFFNWADPHRGGDGRRGDSISHLCDPYTESHRLSVPLSSFEVMHRIRIAAASDGIVIRNSDVTEAGAVRCAFGEHGHAPCAPTDRRLAQLCIYLI